MADYDSSLPVRTETPADIANTIVDSTGTYNWVIDANGIGQVNLNDGTNALAINADGSLSSIITDGTDTLGVNADGSIDVNFASGSAVQITDGTDTLAINSDGTIGIGDGTEQLLINTDGSITSQISDGTDSLAINSDGSINVNVVDSVAGDDIQDYATSASVAAGATTTVLTYTVTAGKTLFLDAVQASGSAKWKAELKVGPSGSEVTKAVFFGSTSDSNEEHIFPTPIEVVATDNVLVVMTNRDNQAQDLYAFINGHEV